MHVSVGMCLGVGVLSHGMCIRIQGGRTKVPVYGSASCSKSLLTLDIVCLFLFSHSGRCVLLWFHLHFPDDC